MSDAPDPQPQPSIVEVEPTATIVVRGSVPMAELPAFFDGSFGRLGAALGELGVAPTGPAFALYHGAPGEVADLEVGFPLAAAVEPGGVDVGETAVGGIAASELPGGRIARFVHHGSFDGLSDAWGRLAEWVTEQGLQPSDDLWEVYVTEPSPDMDPADLRTELNWPIVA